MPKIPTFLFVYFIGISASFAQVSHSGAMSQMAKSGFESTIRLDSLKDHKGLIGLGPLGKMEGEITILNGEIYSGKSLISGQITVESNWEVEAPFLVYAQVKNWKKFNLSGTASSIQELEEAIKQAAISNGIDVAEPFFFKVEGLFEDMTTHIVTPRSPEVEGFVQGQNQKNLTHQSQSGQLIGVYSTIGQRIYTHHDSFMHEHFLDKKKKYTGHLDRFQGGLSQLSIFFQQDRVQIKQ
jgi:acetolactate decarboxylase